MDAAIVPFLADPDQRTSFAVRIDTPVVRRFTNYPAGLTLSSESYVYREFEVGNVVESSDGSTRVSCTLTIADADNAVFDLVSDFANASKPVAIYKLHFSSSWATGVEVWSIVGTPELWFSGKMGKASFEGTRITLPCAVYLGRTGPSPKTKLGEFMPSLAPPDQDSAFLRGDS